MNLFLLYLFLYGFQKNISKYDLLELNYVFCFTTTVASFFARLRGIPYVVRTLGQLSPWCLEQSALVKKVYKVLFELRTLNSAVVIRTSSKTEAKEIKEYGVKNDFIVEPHGVKTYSAITDAASKLKEKYSITKDKKIILFLARIHQKKRLDLLIDSVANLVQQGRKDLFLLIAGEGSKNYIEELKLKVKELGLGEITKFTGFIKGDDKALAFQGSDVYVLPSYQENFGLSVAEALATGLPSIISDEIHIAEDINQANAAVVITPSLESLSIAVNDLLDNTEKSKQFSEKAKHFTESQYSWPAIGARLANHYHQLI